MQHSRKDLSIYRIERAREDLKTAKINCDNGMYKAAVNRSYYAIFHAIRAVNVWDDFDASKHSSVIAHFNQYSDFFMVAKSEALEQIDKAETFILQVEEYLNSRMDT